ncbi:MAG: energy transducer TonB [Chitinophagaceae bacterium]
MATVNKKRMLFGGFIGIAALVIVSSCGNDAGSKSGTEQTSSADTSSIMSADSSAMAKSTVRKKKGKASGIVSMDNTMKVEKDKDGIYNKAEKMPEYPGGEAALSTFVENNISYPQNAIDQNTEGTVNVSFVVDEKGKVINPVATGKSAGNGLDEEAVKIIKQMPAWKPGMVKGKPVKTRLLLPVTFKLEDA